MKLRIRSAGRTERLNFDDNPTVATVKEMAAQVFGYDVVHFDLSLNGRDALSGSSDTPISDFDIVSGDLLRIIVTHKGAAQPQTSNRSQTSNQSLDVKKSETRQAGGTANQNASCVKMDVDNQEKQKSDQGLQHAERVLPKVNDSRPTSGMPDYQMQEDDDDNFMRSVKEPMLCRSATDCLIPHRLSALYTASKPQTLNEALYIVLHVLMLETGFNTEDIPSNSVEPDAATSSKSSIKKRATNMSCALNMPEGWRDKGVHRLKYCHPSCESAVCSLGCVPVGKQMVVHGVTSCKSRFTMHVRAKDYVKALDEDSPKYTNLPQLSKLFKDSIAYPLLLTTRSELGLVPLHGILALFPETQLLILSFLDVKSLLNVSEVNQQFYSLAADRSLWRQLLLRDFGCKESENSWDWRELYTQKYKNKKDLERYQRSLIDRSLPVRPGMFYPPPPFPPTMPGYPPGYRGGDYDLDPFGGLRQPNTFRIRRDPTIGPYPGQPDIVPFPRDPILNPIPRVPNRRDLLGNSRGSRFGGNNRGFYF